MPRVFDPTMHLARKARELIEKFGARIPKKAEELLSDSIKWSIKPAHGDLMTLAKDEGLEFTDEEWVAALLICVQRKFKGKWWEEKRILKELGAEKERVEQIAGFLKENLPHKGFPPKISIVPGRWLPSRIHLYELYAQLNDYWWSARPEVEKKVELMGIEKKKELEFLRMLDISDVLMHLAYEEGLRFDKNEWAAAVLIFIKGTAKEKVIEVLKIRDVKNVEGLLNFLEKKKDYIKKWLRCRV